ncbi:MULTISPECIES: IS5 family transposase [Micromonospora]|uniref:IS5 family transposase n=1 Tax=Micromonospora TaxID=1873 RepID=UPI002101DA47|nr:MULTISPECIES: IS5 family transposase [unclassified Micromonospora]
MPTARPRHYPSDTTDAEWAVLAPHVPAGTGRGRPITYPRRDVVDAIRYLDRTGCQWDALPADFPHHKLVYHYFTTWTRDGTLNRMHNSLREQVREQVEGRTRQPTAALVDSQSVRGAETVGRPGRGYDAGKKVNGRKRHIAVDTCGLLLAILVTGANVQDRDAARRSGRALRGIETQRDLDAHHGQPRPVVSSTRLHVAGDEPHHRYAGTDDGRGTGQELDTKRPTHALPLSARPWRALSIAR